MIAVIRNLGILSARETGNWVSQPGGLSVVHAENQNAVRRNGKNVFDV